MHKKTTRDLRPSGYRETRDTGNVIRETIFDAGARRTNEKEKENTKDKHEMTRGIWPPSYHEAGANLNKIKYISRLSSQSRSREGFKRKIEGHLRERSSPK